MIVSAFLVSLLSTYVILEISELFKLDFITQYSFLQVYGFMVILNLLNHKADEKKKETEDKSFSKLMESAFLHIFTSIAFYLLVWGLANVSYLILS